MRVRRLPLGETTSGALRGRPIKLILFLLLPALFGNVPATAEADVESDEWGSNLWSPSFIIRSGVVRQSASTSGEMRAFFGLPLRPFHARHRIHLWPMLGGDIEVMAPELSVIPGSPRFFLHAGATYTFAGDKDVTKEGEPLGFPEQLPTLATLIDGQGSFTNIELISPIWEGGVGAAFEFEIWDRRVRLRASAEYMRERLRLTGEAYHAIDRGARSDPAELFAARGTRTEHYDAVGGGLGIEVDARRAGPIMLSLLGSVRYYRFIGDRLLQVSATGTRSMPGFPPRGMWSYELDRSAYRVHLGLRFRWQPE